MTTDARLTPRRARLRALLWEFHAALAHHDLEAERAVKRRLRHYPNAERDAEYRRSCVLLGYMRQLSRLPGPDPELGRPPVPADYPPEARIIADRIRHEGYSPEDVRRAGACCFRSQIQVATEVRRGLPGAND